jgi:signal transduction histidine kinase
VSIRKKLQLGILVAGGIALLVLGLTVAWTSRQVSEAIEQSKAIDEVVRGVFELNIITNDYLLHDEERAQAQWQLRYSSLGQILTEVGAKYPEEEEIVDRVIQNHAEIQPLFSQLVTTCEGGGLSELKQRLASQLAVKAQKMVVDTFRLAETARAWVESAKGRGSFLLMAYGVIILALMVSTIVLVSNSIVARVTNLHRGTEIIAAGDLDYQVDVGSRDEIGDLAHAFNEMTRQLRESYGALKEEVTERKKAEAALKEYSGRLEEMVEERTKELQDAQDRLVRSERLAVLGQLAGGVGHELRNPLGAIKNAAYFLNMVLEEPEPEVKETLEILEKEVETSEKIISALLGFARSKPPTKRKVHVNEVIQEALSRTEVPEKVKVVQELDETLREILADPDQLDQVFGNLILNAVQAMPDGGQLTVASKAATPGWIVISVSDTGAGIAKEHQEKLFEPLFTTKAKGIGLGLAIVRTLIDAHGGVIEARSEVGKGSTFMVRLPVGIEEEA